MSFHLHLFGETVGITGKMVAYLGLARVLPKDNIAKTKGLDYCSFRADLICKKGAEVKLPSTKSLSKVGKEVNWENSTELMVGERRELLQATARLCQMVLRGSLESHHVFQDKGGKA